MYSWYISVLPALFLGELCVITITEPPRFENFCRTDERTDSVLGARATHSPKIEAITNESQDGWEKMIWYGKIVYTCQQGDSL